MKLFKTVIMTTFLMLLPAYAFSSNLGYIHISLMEGDVQIKTQESGDWGLALINAPLGEGDQLWVPDGGRLELRLNNGTYIRLDQGSALEILTQDRTSSQFYLSQGHAYVYYNAPAENVIQVDTPDASTRAFDRAVFRIDVPDRYTDVAVYRGYVETENRAGITRITADQMLSLSQDTYGEVAPIGPPDEWEKWNKMRNDTIFGKRGVGSRYLPPELSGYSYDFDSYGRWVNVPGYGHCWTPTVAVGANWAPYRQGRWVWMGGDYVWLAYEPWGWTPYHYGRWIFEVKMGWFWVPPAAGAVYWGPGYVGWVRTGDYVAWVPLAPGEIYYGHGYYGPHSQNITTININQVRITTVYKNVHVHNGVTVVDRHSFATANPRIVQLNQNIIRQKVFVRNNITVGAPAIKPSKAGYFMSSRPVPAAKLPPHRIKTLQVKELKRSRPFIKEQNKSAWNPGERPKTLPLKSISTPRTPGKSSPAIHPVQPSEKGKPGTPSGGTSQKDSRRAAPSEKKPVPQGQPFPREERRVTPSEKQRMTERQPAQKEEKRLAPHEKKPVAQGQAVPKETRRVVQPEKKPTPMGQTSPKQERRIAPPGNNHSPESPQGIKGEKNHRVSGKDEKQKTEKPERLH